MPTSVLVTGASSGIGLAVVLELAAAGYDVVGTTLRRLPVTLPFLG